MPPSFGSVFIFGTAVQMTTAVNPTADQTNAYFGISGVESLFGGTRGRVTLVKGLLYGADVAAFAGAKALFESYYDGVARVLVDTLGVAWSNVKLDSFVPTGKVKQAPDGTVFQQYDAKFLHMSFS